MRLDLIKVLDQLNIRHHRSNVIKWTNCHVRICTDAKEKVQWLLMTTWKVFKRGNRRSSSNNVPQSRRKRKSLIFHKTWLQREEWYVWGRIRRYDFKFWKPKWDEQNVTFHQTKCEARYRRRIRKLRRED